MHFRLSAIFKNKSVIGEINCWLEKSGRLADSPKMIFETFREIIFGYLIVLILRNISWIRKSLKPLIPG